MAQMQYIEAPSEEAALYPSVFLGGGITNCPDWQKVVVDALAYHRDPITVYNPRRKRFPIDDRNAALVQIPWEHRRLRSANVLAFWFSVGSLNPIVLFELGAALERDQALVIGADPRYERIFDVEMQVRLQRQRQHVVKNLGRFAQDISDALYRASSQLRSLG